MVKAACPLPDGTIMFIIAWTKNIKLAEISGFKFPIKPDNLNKSVSIEFASDKMIKMDFSKKGSAIKTFDKLRKKYWPIPN